MNSRINIAVAANRLFMKYLYVMLTSLFENHKKERLCVYLMSAELEKDEIEVFLQLTETYQQELCFLQIEKEMFPKELPVSETITVDSYFRLILPDLLPKELERVLYLDADIILNQSIKEFYYTDFHGKSFCACRDVAEVTAENIHTSPLFVQLVDKPDFVYFNAGVLLMNLEKLRRTVNLEYFMKQAMQVKEALRFHDQDLLNYLFYGDVLFAEETRYNLFARTAYNAGYDYNWVKEYAAVIHYAGPKPWNHKQVRYELELFWWEYAKKTPFYMDFLEDIVLNEIKSGYMETLFRQLKQENDELKQIVDKCMNILKKQ